MSSFGARLQAARHRATYSQAELAARAGLSLRSLQGWEQGRREPAVGSAARLAAALKISLDDLVGLTPILGPRADVIKS